MKVFISGVAGFQGGNIANTLVQAGHEVVSLRRKPEDVTSEMPGITLHVGDFGQLESLNPAFQAIDAAVFTFPLVFDLETARRYAANFIEAAKSNRVDLVIYNTTSDLPKDPSGFSVIDMKILVQELFDASGLKVITLAPDIYIDNMTAPWSIPLITEKGILPYPVSQSNKSPFISHSDLGRYVLSALQHPELAGEVLPIGGNLLNGEEIAQAISSHIGREIKFIELTPDNFQQELTPAFGELAATEISNAYRNLKKDYERIIDKDFARTNELLSIQPQSLEDWVASVTWE